MPSKLPPMRLLPLFKEKVWGGRHLAETLGKELPEEAPVGESWELAEQDEGRTLIDLGEGKTISISEARFRFGEGLLGPGEWEPFPFLFKFIDANEDLSVQVHPDDSLAQRLGKQDHGKTECWVILDAPPHAALYVGLADGVSPVQLFRAIEEGDPAELLGRLPVKAGDVVPVRAGTLHAISAGIVLAELQQPSDLTYRLWDWGRKGLDGEPRPLHLKEAWHCLRAEAPRGVLSPLPHPKAGEARELAALCEYFALERLSVDVDEVVELTTGKKRFEVLSVLEGALDCRFGKELRRLDAGETWLIPASLGKFKVEAAETASKALRFYLHPKGPKAVLKDFGCKEDDEAGKEVSF